MAVKKHPAQNKEFTLKRSRLPPGVLNTEDDDCQQYVPSVALTFITVDNTDVETTVVLSLQRL